MIGNVAEIIAQISEQHALQAGRRQHDGTRRRHGRCPRRRVVARSMGSDGWSADDPKRGNM
jgi:hypothetical protein